MRRFALLLVLVMSNACGTSDPCSDASMPRDANADAPAHDAAASGADASIDHCGGAPGVFGLGPVVEIHGPAEQIPYTHADTRSVHVTIYRRDERTPAYEHDAVGGALFATMPMLAGDYDLAVSAEGYAVGVERSAPEHCVGAGADALHCPVIRFSVHGCRATFVRVALYCDPALGDCPTAAWPWDR